MDRALRENPSLINRLRAGRISIETVQLLAHAGHEEALIAAPPWCPDIKTCDHGVHGCKYCDPNTDQWIERIPKLADRWQCVSIALALARVTITQWSGDCMLEECLSCEPITHILDAIKAWVDCPCDKHAVKYDGMLASNHNDWYFSALGMVKGMGLDEGIRRAYNSCQEWLGNDDIRRIASECILSMAS